MGKHEHDNIIQEITISQRDVDPALKLGVTTTPPKVVINSNGEEKYSVGVTCNVEWTAKVGDSGEGFVRISYSYSIGHLSEALHRIELFLQELGV
mgnify:CR=1 FL=1